MAPPGTILIAGPTASGKSALALAAGRTASAASSSMPIPCRSIAICASSRRGRAPAEEARVPHRLYGHVDAAENYSVGRWCQDAARGAATRPGAEGRAADPGRRHRALFQGADPGAFGGAADAARDPRRRCGPAATPKAPRRCMPSLPAAIRRWPSGSSPATACGSRGRWKCWRRPDDRSRTGTATACRRSSTRTRR